MGLFPSADVLNALRLNDIFRLQRVHQDITPSSAEEDLCLLPYRKALDGTGSTPTCVNVSSVKFMMPTI